MSDNQNKPVNNPAPEPHDTPQEPPRAAPQATPPQKGFPNTTTTPDTPPDQEKNSDMPFDPEAKAPYRSVYIWAAIIIAALIVLYLIFR